MQNQQQLQGVVMPGSSGSAPRIPSSLHTRSGYMGFQESTQKTL